MPSYNSSSAKIPKELGTASQKWRQLIVSLDIFFAKYWPVLIFSLARWCCVQGLCKLMVAVFNYLLVTNFFWMLVEGLYLHTVIVWTFSSDHLRCRHYEALGWGEYSALLFSLTRDSIYMYAIARYVLSPVRPSVCHTGGSVKDGWRIMQPSPQPSPHERSISRRISETVQDRTKVTIND